RHLNDGLQLGDIERFLQMVVGPGFAGQLGDIGISAEENDGNILCFGGQLEQTGSFDAAGTGYPVVHQDHIRVKGPDLADDLVGIAQGLHIEAFFSQDDGTDLQDIQIVIQYQNSFVHVRVLLQISAINSVPANGKNNSPVSNEQRLERIPGQSREKMHRNDHSREQIGSFQVEGKLICDRQQHAGEAHQGKKKIENDLSPGFQ